MSRSKLKINQTISSNPLVRKSEFFMSDLTFEEFFNIFEKFINLKTLEGLASTSIQDYKIHIKYFRDYLERKQRTPFVRSVDIDVFRGYIFYMSQEKEFKLCTINIRLRTIKAYLR